MTLVPGHGPSDAEIMIIGEAPGEQETKSKIPFVGSSGRVLDDMLHCAGIARSSCYITNVVKIRPPDNNIEEFISQSKIPGGILRDGMYVLPFVLDHLETLRKEISIVRPNVIIALGNIAMWATTGKIGISKWQGSTLRCLLDGCEKVVPCLHPASILRMWEDRFQTLAYLARAKRESMCRKIETVEYSFLLRPSLHEVLHTLNSIPPGAVLSVDIETRSKQIACVGIAWSKREAICIPIICINNPKGYWTELEEFQVVKALRDVLTSHPIVGQNLLYDCQYFVRQWGFSPSVEMDIMLWHHACFPGFPKSLYYQSSLYCEHYEYWKDEGKEWTKNMDEISLWNYNCLDCCYTFEVSEALRDLTKKLGLLEQASFQQSLFFPVLEMMLRGVRIDHERKADLEKTINEKIAVHYSRITKLVGHELNIRSPKQLKEFFYEDLKIKPIFHRKTRKETVDEDALDKIAKHEPLLSEIVGEIKECRHLEVLKSTFVEAELDDDGRLRCSYNIAGTETFRFSSSQDAFGSGTNLQNIPRVDDGDESKIRHLFLPDEGNIIMDWDLDRADLQIVVWESDEIELKQMLRENVDIHTENSKFLGCSRQLAKTWVHGTNYGGSPRTMAVNCGITIAQSEKMQKRWFSRYPGIYRWHKRVEASLRESRCVKNIFGFRRFYPDRTPELPKALAWIPQSTVAIVINKGLINIYHNLPSVKILLQVHDSLVLQCPDKSYIPKIRECLSIPIPYSDILIIPVSCKMSTKNWGSVERIVLS